MRPIEIARFFMNYFLGKFSPTLFLNCSFRLEKFVQLNLVGVRMGLIFSLKANREYIDNNLPLENRKDHNNSNCDGCFHARQNSANFAKTNAKKLRLLYS